jgi:hypothetical protein
MSYHAAENPDVRLPWFQKKSVLIIAAAVLCLLAAGVGFLTYTGARNIPDISGELTIEADPDTRIYIGDKLVGTTKATLTWAELFGDETHELLAMKLPNAAGAIPPNSSEGGMLSSDVAVPPESLGGRGAKALLSENLSGYQIPPFGKISGTREWIRRADGALDYIIVIEWTQNNRPAECFVLPVRVRKGAGASWSAILESFRAIPNGNKDFAQVHGWISTRPIRRGDQDQGPVGTSKGKIRQANPPR